MDTTRRRAPESTTPFQLGARVEGGWGEDHDVGVVGDPSEGDGARPAGSVWVRWDSGVSTWTPADTLFREGEQAIAARRAIRSEYEHDGQATLDAICERHNCESAHVDEDGDVHIEGPQQGHWLDDDALIALVSYGREHHGWA